MIPWETLGRARAGDAELVLMRRGRDFSIRASGRELMSSRSSGSERALAELGCARAVGLPQPRVLVGGLGMGYTLRAALDLLPEGAEVVVAELVAEVVEWNRDVLAALAGRPLDDPRVSVAVGDVAEVARRAPPFDAILLDVDNGPAAFTRASNAGLYGDRGVAALRSALRASGVLAVWSAGPDARFVDRLRSHGFDPAVESVRARDGGRARHTIFLGHLRR